MKNTGKSFTIPILSGECWWGGAVQDGVAMPFGGAPFSRDLRAHLSENQGTGLLISNKGRYLWSEEPYQFSVIPGKSDKKNKLSIAHGVRSRVVLGKSGRNLKDAFLAASRKFFPPKGKCPPSVLFTSPQYNTWIELMYQQEESKILKYARGILANGFPTGVLMIDAGWQEYYGDMTFHPGRFPNPRKMIQKLHRMGFKVMLWVCPFITPDSIKFRWLDKQGYLLKHENGGAAIQHWWDGYSAVLDLTNPDAKKWFSGELNKLVRNLGVDGFKFDAGDPLYYKTSDAPDTSGKGHRHCEAWARLGLEYSYNEYRACWNCAGEPLVQRLSDKRHRWDREGLASLIPNGLAQGLIGHAFTCPDMIGGGSFADFLKPEFKIDGELFVRYAQCSALFPMMQFSTAPWRVLNRKHLSYCKKAAELHLSLGQEFKRLARHAAKTGEPIIRHMAYVFPNGGFETLRDQFMVGDSILVAPVLEQGSTQRSIVFPEGTWLGDDGTTVNGSITKTVSAPLSRLPWYRKIAASKI